MYLVEGRSQNKKLWLKDTALRDNGEIIIGTYFAIPNLNAINTFMADDMSLVVAGNLVIVLKYPTLASQDFIEITITKN